MTEKNIATSFVKARIDKNTKVEAEEVLEKIGLSTSDAIRMFYRQIVLRKGLPFSVNIPNTITRKSLSRKEMSKSYPNTEEMFDEILGNKRRDI